ncbi:MAG: LysR family transcriptional regulator [Deltaproteobacteria bacterium]|nr:LysR family transcriptional regulator [Deltaproteobacteria bacterium]
MLVTVADEGSLTAAARRLGVPKSTVGRAVARLEQSLGVALLRRSGGTYTLTDPGQRLAVHAAPHVASLRDATLAIRGDSAEPHGTLRVTAPLDLGQTLLAPILPRYLARYPQVRVEIDLTSRFVDLVSERFDAAIRATGRPMPSTSLVARKLAPVEMRLFASPTYVARRGLPRDPDDLAFHDCVMPAFPNDRLTLTSERHSKTVVVAARLTGNDFLFIREAIVAGGGIGPLAWSAARDELEAGRLVRVLPDWCFRGGFLYLVYPPARPLAPKLAAFRDIVLAHAARLLVAPPSAP